MGAEGAEFAEMNDEIVEHVLHAVVGRNRSTFAVAIQSFLKSDTFRTFLYFKARSIVTRKNGLLYNAKN